jgi:CBS domain-containing protein
MTCKQLFLRAEAGEKIICGAAPVADAVRVTLGPKSKCVLIGKKCGRPLVCNDGVTIAKEFEIKGGVNGGFVMEIIVGQVMTRGVETISAAATLEQAAKTMRDHNVGILPVIDDDRVVGVLTDRDIVLRAVSTRMRPEMTRVRDVMTLKAISCREDEDISNASVLMEKNFIHRLIVLDRNEKFVGIVSLSDIAAKAANETLSGYILGKVSAA